VSIKNARYQPQQLTTDQRGASSMLNNWNCISAEVAHAASDIRTRFFGISATSADGLLGRISLTSCSSEKKSRQRMGLGHFANFDGDSNNLKKTEKSKKFISTPIDLHLSCKYDEIPTGSL